MVLLLILVMHLIHYHKVVVRQGIILFLLQFTALNGASTDESLSSCSQTGCIYSEPAQQEQGLPMAPMGGGGKKTWDLHQWVAEVQFIRVTILFTKLV